MISAAPFTRMVLPAGPSFKPVDDMGRRAPHGIQLRQEILGCIPPLLDIIRAEGIVEAEMLSHHVRDRLGMALLHAQGLRFPLRTPM